MANKIRVTLDPGHSWNVNQGAVKSYYESNAMFDFAYQLKGQLDLYGIFDVYITKDTLKINPTLEARANMALKNGSRFFVSLHSNACGTESVYRTVIYNSVKRKETDAVAKKMTDAISGVLKSHGQGVSGTIQYKANTYGTDYYGVLRSAAATDGLEFIMLIEHDFHTNTKACTMMSTDTIMEEIAKAEAKVIYDALKDYYVGDHVTVYSGSSTTTLNVRTGPGINYPRLGSFAKGGAVKVVSKDPATGWYKVLWNGAAAWADGHYISGTFSTLPDDKNVDFGLPKINGTSTAPATPKPVTGSLDTKTVYETYGIEVVANVVGSSLSNGDMTGKVNCTDGLNVRSGPGTNYTKIGYLPCGSLVAIVPLTAARPSPDPMVGWHYVVYMDGGNIKEGFVFAEYVDSVVQTTPKAKVNATAGLNYRTGPATTYSKVGVLTHGTVVYTLGTTNGWTKIRLSLEDKNVYYVSSQYLVEVADVTKESFWYSYQDCDYGKAKNTGTIRSCPKSSGSKIGNLVKNRIYCIASYAENDTWAKVVCSQEFGYVLVSDLEVISKASKEERKYEVTPEIAKVLEDLPEMTASEWFVKILGAKISSPYGYRTNPLTGTGTQFHTGIDFACPSGTPIYSEVEGLCTFNAYDSSCGNMVILLDEMGKQHRFYHMKSAGIPKVGEFVGAGQLIGYVGTTGDSTGNHLHYEVRIAPWTMSNTVSPDSIAFQ